MPNTEEFISMADMGWGLNAPEGSHGHPHVHYVTTHGDIDEYGSHEHPHTHIRTAAHTDFQRPTEHQHDEEHNG